MSWAETKKINSNMSLPLNEGGVKIAKKVQYGTVSIPLNQTVGTATISAVDPSKSMLINLGSADTSGEYINYSSDRWDMLLTLIDSTHIRATRATVSRVASVNYCLVEFY